MDIDELSKLRETNYFTLVAGVLGGFNKMDRSTLLPIYNEDNDIKIVSESEKSLEFQFKHDNIDYCSGSLDFDENGNVINFRALFLPVGVFGKKRAHNALQSILNLLQLITQRMGGDLQTVIRNRHYQLHYGDLLISLVMMKNLQGKYYVSTWCEYS